MSTITAANRTIGRRHAAIGSPLLWIGSILFVAFQIVFDGVSTLQHAETYSDRTLIITAWAIVLISDAAVVVVTRVLGEHLPNWFYWLWALCLGTAIALDIVATSDASSPGAAMSAGVSASVSLLLATITRPLIEVALTAAAFGIGTTVAWANLQAFRPDVAQDAVLALCQMVLPVVVGTIIVDSFHRLMRRETEEILSQAAIVAPRLTVGIEASEQLARLDLAAESLLGAVADGRIQLPLDSDVAKRAGSLATELRLHLLASRRKTWLGLAVDESTLLRQRVRITDPDAAAGLLGTRQRAALLSALWLLHDEHRTATRSALAPIELTFSAPFPSTQIETVDIVSIRIVMPGTTRRMLDPGVWGHFARVGRYRESLEGNGIRVDIHAQVPTSRRRPRGRTD